MDERNDLVLRMLRDIRTKLDKLDEHDRRFDAIDARFADVDKQLETIKYQLTYSLGLSGTANLLVTQSSGRVDTLEQRQVRFEADMAELKRKMAEIEARFDR